MHRKEETYWRGLRSLEVEEEGEPFLTLQCHRQNDSFIKTGSDENHFKVSLLVRATATRQCPEATFLKREESRSEESNRRRPFTSLTPYRWAKSRVFKAVLFPERYRGRPRSQEVVEEGDSA